MILRASTIPNTITVGRIILCPVVSYLILIPTFTARFIGWLLFLVAAFSDLFDGYLARKHGWISDLGKLLDPIADKLLLVATLLPLYVLSQQGDEAGFFPVFGELPLWIVLVVFGREVLVTVIRMIAARNGIVIPAGRAGKHKTIWQYIFIGAAIFWYALRAAALRQGWSGALWEGWMTFHAFVLIVSLVGAVFLTVYSLLVYLWSWRKLARVVRPMNFRAGEEGRGRGKV